MQALPEAWSAVMANPGEGLRALLAPLATTDTARACLEVICAKVSEPRVESVRMAALAVEHPEQLSRHVEGDARDALVLSLELPSGGGPRRLVIGPDEGKGPAFFACGEASSAPSMAHSVWARDDFLLEDADEELVELLMECACLIEFSEWRWVVAEDPDAGPRYLVTARLDREFQGTRDGGLDVDELDGSISLPELFLREVAGLLVPHEGRKLMFHPELQVTPTRAFVPETARRWPG